jgi:bifunctional non-homologous end joining protein LigD
LFAEACRMGLEGIVCKRTDATYRPGRSTTWLKVKSCLQGEFVIVGYTDSKPAGGLGALLLAERSGGDLVFVGKVGTGFSGREAEMLRTHLRVVRRKDPCLPVPKKFRRASACWAEPKLIAAVRYATRTTCGIRSLKSSSGSMRGKRRNEPGNARDCCALPRIPARDWLRDR